ncbi:MAG: outer membrane beta-barrel protein [Cytophagales bacterium]|nr:PorT family protein [Bernardetiaceae bacterium]MDW8205851.1 outer membrane beta-barrel protein [Cytophagales bacterium]
MKKIVLLITGLMISAPAWAQTTLPDFIPPDTLRIERNARVRIGVQAGWGQSRYYGSDLQQLSADGQAAFLGGLTVGLQAVTQAGKYFSLLHEINWQQGGSRIRREDDNGNLYDARLRTWSVQIVPVAPAFTWQGISLYAAPYVSALAGGFITDSADKKDRRIFGDPQNTTETDKYLQKFDFGALTGIGWASRHWHMSLRYQIGRNPLLDNANVFTFDQTQPVIRIYQQSWQLLVGYRF